MTCASDDISPTFNMYMIEACFLLLILTWSCDATISENTTQIGKKRIIGGKNCNAEDHKGMVSIRDPMLRHRCGGTTLSDRWILTAAHCLDRGSIIVVVSVPNESIQNNIYVPQSLHRHPKYDQKDLNHDVALIYLSTPIPRNKLVAITFPPQELAKYEINRVCGTARAKGWGYTDENDIMSETLQCVDLDVLDYQSCISHYHYYAGKTIHSDNIVCTSSRNGKDACTGDSGGPLICHGAQIGIISWGIDCANPKYPGIFTRVDKYMPFITETMKGKRYKTEEYYDDSTMNKGQILSKLPIIGFILLPFIKDIL